MPLLRGFLDKLTQPPEEIRDEHLRTWVEALPGITPIQDLAERRRFKVAGVIQNIRIDPREGSGSIEVTISDGTGDMMVKWLAVLGLVLAMLVLNPEYQLTTGPR